MLFIHIISQYEMHERWNLLVPAAVCVFISIVRRLSATRPPLSSPLFVGHFHGVAVNVVDDVMRRTTVYRTSNTLGSAQDLFGGSGQLPGHGTRSHRTGDGQDIVESDVSRMFDCVMIWAKEKSS